MCRAPPVTIATLPPNLIRTPRAIGVMEYWSTGIQIHRSTIPLLESYNSSFQPFQMFLEVQGLPPRLDPQRLGDNPRGIVTRSAGDVTARMTGRAAQVKTVNRRSVVPPAREWPVLQRLIAGVLAHHPIAAIHVAVMSFDIEGRRGIRRQYIVLVQVRRKALPNRHLFLEPLTADFVPIERITPKIVRCQLPHESRGLSRRRLGRIMKRRGCAVHKRFAWQLTGPTIFE